MQDNEYQKLTLQASEYAFYGARASLAGHGNLKFKNLGSNE